MKNILVYLILFIEMCLNIKAQDNTIIVKGYKIPLNKISINGEPHKIDIYGKNELNNKNLIVNSESDKVEEVKVYASENKEYFAISIKSRITQTLKSNELLENYDETILGIYDKNGKLVFEKSMKDRTPTTCNISNNGKFTHVNWVSNYENENMAIFKVYNQNGDEIFTENDLKYYPVGKNKNIIYYQKDDYYPKNHEYAYMLYFKDFENNSAWSREFNESSKFDGVVKLSVSENNGNILCASDKIYSLNSKGDIIWEKEFDVKPGFFFLSGNGDYLVRIPEIGKYELYRNSDGALLFEKKNEIIDNYHIVYFKACFIEGEDDIFAVTAPLGSMKLMIIFYDLKGNRLDHIFIENFYSDRSFKIFKSSSGTSYDIYLNGIKAISYSKNF